MGQSIGEFFIDLLVDSSKGELSVGNLVTKMGELEAASVGTLGVLFELGSKLAQFTDATIQTSLGIKSFETATGGSGVELQKWQKILNAVNADGNSAAGVFETLSSKLTKLHTGQGNAFEALISRGVLGANLKTMTQGYEVLEAIANSKIFKGFSTQLQTEYLSQIGIPSDYKRALALPESKRNEYANEAGNLSEEDIAKFTEIHGLLARMSDFAKSFAQEIATWSAEPLANTLKEIIKAMKDFHDLYIKIEALGEKHPIKGSQEQMIKGTSGFIIDISKMITNSISPLYNSKGALSSRFEDVLNFNSIFKNMIPIPAGTHFGPTQSQAHQVTNNFNGMYTPEVLKQVVFDAINQVFGTEKQNTGSVIANGSNY